MHRTSTTVIGILVICFGALGFLWDGVYCIGAASMHIFDQTSGIAEAALSVLTKILLVLGGIMMLTRSRGVGGVFGVALICSIAATCLNLAFLAPPPPPNLQDEAGRVGYYIGLGGVTMIPIVFYIPLLIFLNTASAKAEWNGTYVQPGMMGGYPMQGYAAQQYPMQQPFPPTAPQGFPQQPQQPPTGQWRPPGQ